MAEELKQKVLSRNHHKAVLSEMYKFVFESQSLTDVSFVCQNGTLVYAHRKVLVEISPLLRKIANSRPKEDRLYISTNDIPKEVLINFLSLAYKGEVKHLSEVEITQVNQVCQLFGVDIQAVQLNKAKPKDSPTRKKNLTLGSILKEPTDTQEKEETTQKMDNIHSVAAKKSEKRKRVLHQEAKKSLSSSEKKPRSASLSSTNEPVKLYCLCREPERPGMIGCDYCEEWYHISCLNLKKEDAKQLTKCKWQCPKCELESNKKAKIDQITERPTRRTPRKPSLPTKRPSSTLSSSSSSSSPSSSSSSGSSSDSDSSHSNAPEVIPTLKKTKLVTRNGTNNESLGRKLSTDELHFCYICKSIFISQNAKKAHDKEHHS